MITLAKSTKNCEFGRKNMKIISLLFILLACRAFAGLETDVNLNGTSTNVVAAASSNQYSGTVIFTANSPEITLASSCTASNAVTGTAQSFWDVSIDGKIWMTNFLSLTVTLAGVNAGTTVSNMPPGYKFPYYRASKWYNSNATIISNLNNSVFYR